MSLKILKKYEKFCLNGKINTLTCKRFENYIQYNFNLRKTVIINIDKVNEIDKDGLEVINTLIYISIRDNKVFSIEGRGSKEIYEHYDHAVAI
jgi:hypothetical protein